jgi:predicted Rossmann fold flavoprotein
MFSITDSSQTIIDCLLQEASRYNVHVLLQREVKAIMQVPALTGSGHLELEFAQGAPNTADYVMVASGGAPKAAMFSWLQQLGHTIVPPVPSLFTLNMPGNSITALMGVSVERARVKIVGAKLEEEGPLLITHWGLSGPAILKLSAWGARELADRNYRCQVVVNWVPQYNEHTLREQWQGQRNDHAAQKTGNRNPFGLPNRLWIYLLNQSGINEDIRWADLPGKEQNRLISNLTAQPFDINGKTTFKEEFVTCGGIKLSEIDPQTMESRLVPNLYFGGEVMDVDGVTGGFNFQHAWTSGWIAAKAIAEKATAAPIGF